jgi:hypothetical protein
VVFRLETSDFLVDTLVSSAHHIAMTASLRKLAYFCFLFIAVVAGETSFAGKLSVTHLLQHSDTSSKLCSALSLRGGAWLVPAGWHPFGYKLTTLGDELLGFGGSLDCDVGRFLASLKAKRSTRTTMKDSWREIVRVSKTAQSMRVYRQLDELIAFCLKAGLID